MNEAEWNACTAPWPMLDFLRTSDKFSDRKARLFAVASGTFCRTRGAGRRWR